MYLELKAGGDRNARAELINARGQVVRGFNNLTPGTNALRLGNLPVGVYTVRLFARGRFWQRRVVVR
jgi:hypothetical protein